MNLGGIVLLHFVVAAAGDERARHGAGCQLFQVVASGSVK